MKFLALFQNQYVVEICKVRTSWETHKIWKKTSSCCKCPKHEEDCANSESMNFTRKIVYYSQKMRIAIDSIGNISWYFILSQTLSYFLTDPQSVRLTERILMSQCGEKSNGISRFLQFIFQSLMQWKFIKISLV